MQEQYLRAVFQDASTLHDCLTSLDQNLENLRLNNSEMKIQINNYTMNIQQLEEERNSLTVNINSLSIQIQNLIAGNNQKDEQIEHQQNLLSSLEKELMGTINSLEGEKLNLESHIVMIGSENDRLIKILFDKFANFQEKIKEIRGFQGQMTTELKAQLKLVQEYYTQDKEFIRELAEKANKERESFASTKSEYERKIWELKEYIGNLENDNNIMSQQLNQSKCENQSLQQQFSQFSNEKSDEILDLKNKFQIEIQITLEQQEAGLRKNFEAELAKADGREKQLKQKVQDLENQRQYLTSELERITQSLNQTLNELDQQKAYNGEMQQQYERERTEIWMEFEKYKQTHYMQTDIEIKFKAEKQTFESNIAQLLQKIKELENEIIYLQGENKKLNQLSIQRMKEIELWKVKLSESGLQAEVEDLRRQLQQQKEEIFATKEKLLKTNSEKNKLQSQATQQASDLQNQQEELQRAYELINMTKQQTGGVYTQANDQKKENDLLKSKINQVEGEILLQKENSESIKRQNQELQKENLQFKQSNSQMNDKLTKLQSELIQRNKEIEHWKLKYDDAITSVNMKASNFKIFENSKNSSQVSSVKMSVITNTSMTQGSQFQQNK